MAANPQPDDEWQHWSSADVSAPGGFEKHIGGGSWLESVADDPIPTVADDYYGTAFDLNGHYAPTTDESAPDDPDGAAD